MRKEEWPLFLHVVNVLGFTIIVVGFLNGGSYRVIFFGIVLMLLSVAYSLYKIIRYIAEKRSKS